MTNPKEYYHLTVDGVPACASPLTSTVETNTACEFYSRDAADIAQAKLAAKLPSATVVVVPCRCPRPNAYEKWADPDYSEG